MSMSILVTGGAGFIGSTTVDALVNVDAGPIAVLDHLSSGKREQVNPKARFYQVNLCDAAAVKEVMARERPEIIYHFAAQMDVRRSVADPAFDAEVNLVGFLNLMEAGRQHGLRRCVLASTGGAIYGEQQAFPCDEDHPCHPLSPYGIAKLASEKYLFFYRAQYGIEYLALRYANVYGPRQDPHGEAGVVAIFCRRLLDGQQTRDYTYVGDVVRANLYALTAKAADLALNIGTGRETSVNALYASLAQAAGETRPAEHAPARPGEQLRSVISPRRAAAQLGWKPEVELADGLDQTLRYFRAGRGH